MTLSTQTDVTESESVGKEKMKTVWSRLLSRLQLYDACWIMGNIPDMETLFNKNPYWSLLPVRYYNNGSWDYQEIYRFSSVGHYVDGIEFCKSADICPSQAYFAQKLWETSAKLVYEKYPEILNISFGNQADDGVYHIVFKHPIEEIASVQIQFMHKLIEDGFSINEHLKMEQVDTPWRRTWQYEGIADYSYKKLYETFHQLDYGKSLPLAIRNHVSFEYKECEEYFKTFDEQMLILGNQRRAYRHFEPINHDLFSAAKACDKRVVRHLIDCGRSINEIDPSGNSAFSLLLDAMLRVNETNHESDISTEDESFLDYLYDHGANIDLIGVDECAEVPLLTASVNHADRLFHWLLDHGADTMAEIFYDEPYLNDSSYTVEDWVREHSSE